MGNRSLDDFLDADGTDADGSAAPDGADADGSGAADATDAPDATDDGEATDPEVDGNADDEGSDRTAAAVDEAGAADSTYVWRSSAGTCADCGERVAARWRQGDDLVCRDCKAW